MVKICTQYAQDGMFNIFIVIFCLTLAYAFFDPIFFVAYLVSIAVVGLFQAVYMANAGGAWDNAKKVVEVELHEKGTPLHDATVIGDTVGDPVQGHVLGGARTRSSSSRRCSACWRSRWGRQPGDRASDRRRAVRGRAVLRLPLVLRHAHLVGGPRESLGGATHQRLDSRSRIR